MSAFSAPAQVTTTTAVTASSSTSGSTPTPARLSDNFSASVGSRAAAATLIEGMLGENFCFGCEPAGADGDAQRIQHALLEHHNE
jgi:hypothetical protein